MPRSRLPAVVPRLRDEGLETSRCAMRGLGFQPSKVIGRDADATKYIPMPYLTVASRDPSTSLGMTVTS